MPKHLFKRYLPDPKVIKENKYLKIFGQLLHSNNLWHLNRRSVARAVAIGLFSAFMPMPFQMVLAAAMAIIFRANLPISVVLVWITNPFTMPPIFYFTYKVGAAILDAPHEPFHMEFSLHWLEHKFFDIWKPLLLGSFICGAVSALIGYLLVRIVWRILVIRQYHDRCARLKDKLLKKKFK